jgi:hypothetical protein
MAKKNVTFVITDELDRNIEIQAAIDGKQKSEIVSEALSKYFLTTKTQKEKHPVGNGKTKISAASNSR